MILYKRYSDPDMFDDDIRDEVLEYFVDKIFVYDDRIIVTGPYFEGIAEQLVRIINLFNFFLYNGICMRILLFYVHCLF